jgi:hypothetical protein
MTPQRFNEFLEEQHRKVAIPLDWSARLKEWQSDTDDFFKMIERYLGEYLKDKKVSIKYATKTFTEPGIPDHEAKTACLKVGPTKITIGPVGLNVIGAKGRIDMVGPRGTARFLLMDKRVSYPKQLIRVNIQHEKDSPAKFPKHEEANVEWEWKIATDPPNISFFPLTAENFLEAIIAVTNG